VGTESEASNPDGRSAFAALRELYAGTMGRLERLTGGDPMPFTTSHALAGDWTMVPVPVALDGMMGIPPRKIPAPAGGWCAPDDMAELYAEAATARDAYGVYLWENTPGFIMPPSDEEVMQPIVEAAMRAEGMNVPLRPIIPTITRGRRRHGR
jgi:hypothetical protein